MNSKYLLKNIFNFEKMATINKILVKHVAVSGGEVTPPTPTTATLSWKINNGVDAITITSPYLGVKTTDGSTDLDIGTRITWSTSAKDGYAIEPGSGWTRKTAASVNLDGDHTISPIATEAYSGLLDIQYGTTSVTGSTFESCMLRTCTLTSSEDPMDPLRGIERLTDHEYIYFNEKYKIIKSKTIILDMDGTFKPGYYRSNFGFHASINAAPKNCYVRLRQHSGFTTKSLDQTIGTGYNPTGYICNLVNPAGEVFYDQYWRVMLEIVPTADDFSLYLQCNMRDNAI